MAWGTAASFVASYMRRARPRRSSKVSSVSSRAEPLRPREMSAALRSPEATIPTQSGPPELLTPARSEPAESLTPTGSGSPESRTQPMVPLASTTVSKQRSERRIAVRLPLKVSGRDSHGFAFEEDTSSENLCRNGAAFVTRFDVAIGSDLEIRIAFLQYASRRTNAERLGSPRNGNRFSAARNSDTDFATHGRVVHVCDSPSGGEKLVGVQFTGPRFQRVFRSESAA